MSTFQTPIWNYMSGFNPFNADGVAVILTFILLFAIIYSANRGEKGSFEKSVNQILVAMLGAGIIYFFTASSLLAGVGMIVIYLLDLKLRWKIPTKLFFIISFKLWGGFAIFSLLDAPLRELSLVFIIFTIFIQRSNKLKKG